MGIFGLIMPDNGKFNWLKSEIRTKSEQQRLYKKIRKLYSSEEMHFSEYSSLISQNSEKIKYYLKEYLKLKKSNSNSNSTKYKYIKPKYVYTLDLYKQHNHKNANSVFVFFSHQLNAGARVEDKIEYFDLYELHLDLIQIEKVFTLLSSTSRIKYFKTFKISKKRNKKLDRIFNI